jgi:hypothetical protein
MKETWKWALLRVPEDLDDSPGYALAGVAPRNDSRAMAAPLSIGLARVVGARVQKLHRPRRHDECIRCRGNVGRGDNSNGVGSGDTVKEGENEAVGFDTFYR